MSSLSSTIEDYLTLNYTLADRTRKIYREHLSRLCLYASDPPISDIDHRVLSAFMGSLRQKNGQKYAPAYLDQIYRTLKTFFQFCQDESLIAENPMRRVKRPKLESGPKPRLTLEQIGQLINQVKKTDLSARNLVIVLLMVDSGLRLNEVIGLRACDVRLEDGSVLVLSEKTQKRREVPVRDEVLAAITKYLSTRPPFKTPQDHLLLNRAGDRLTKEAVHLLMKRLQKRLNFPLYSHLLRHTFANIYIKKGELRKLQKLMGHSRIDTTARFYTDPEMKDIKAEHDLSSPLAQLFDESKKKE